MKQNIIIILLSAICAILGYIAAQISNEPERQQQTQIVAASPVTQPNPTPTQSIPTTANNHDEIIDGGIIKPIKMPKYPERALDNGEEGIVLVEIETDKSGKVNHSRIAKTSGYPSLDNSALKSAKLEIYAPATSKGEPMRTRYYVQYTFKLPQ